MPRVLRRGSLTWKDLGKHIWLEFYEGDILTRSAALSYYFLLALFPLLLFLMALLGYLTTGTELRDNLLDYLSKVAPGSASELIYTTVNEINNYSGGGKISIGILAALWAASSGMTAIIDTLNSAYGVKESRPLWKTRLVAICLTVVLAIFIILSLALIFYSYSLTSSISAKYGYESLFAIFWKIIQWPLVLFFVLVAFAIIYYYAPDVHDQRWYWVTPGAIVGLSIWLFISFLFKLYLTFFDSYTITYGSLGAVIVLMLWFYLTGTAILVGGKINSVIENAAAEAGEPEAKLHGDKSVASSN
jgi:membrane protein